MKPKRIVACIDCQSPLSDHTIDYAAWISTTYQKRLDILNITDDISLNQYKEEEQALLNTYATRAFNRGVEQSLITIHQEHGALLEKIIQYETNTELLIIGRYCNKAKKNQHDIGYQTSQIILATHKPILSVTTKFSIPKTIMVAYNGSKFSQKIIKILAENKLFQCLPTYLVMSGKATKSRKEQLEWAHQALIASGYDVISSFIVGGGSIEDTIVRTVQEQCIDILIMGHFDNRPLYHMIFGSKIAELLKYLNIPILHLH